MGDGTNLWASLLHRLRIRGVIILRLSVDSGEPALLANRLRFKYSIQNDFNNGSQYWASSGRRLGTCGVIIFTHHCVDTDQTALSSLRELN